MSVEGSSSGTKRKRHASTRGQEKPANAPLRVITYRGDGIPHGQSTMLWDSPLLQFAHDSAEHMKFDVIKKVKLLEFRRIDWELVGRLGQVERLEQLLGPKFRMALDCDEPQHHGAFAEPGVVSFVLGKRIFNMTLPQFVVQIGFYTQQEVEDPGFIGLLRGVVKKKQDHCVVKADLARFWRTIAISPFSNNMVASDIRDPLYRFVHKILAATLIGRQEGDNKVNHHSLFCLMCLVESPPANLASVLAWWLVRPKKGGKDARLFGGPYITRLAERFRVFADYPAERMHTGPAPPAPSLMELNRFQQARIITYDDPSVWLEVLPEPPLPDSAAADAMQTIIPLRYQVPLQRHQLSAREYPIRPPRPEPLTLEGVYDRVDSLFAFVEDVRQENVAGRQEMRDGMRVIMDRLQVQPPPSWQPHQEDPAGG
ncbi:hypothetical protein HanHA300_Chr14g0508451 [Helianthus annuus]|nr:hypothetical protein HanHA300_Chr14g0508451 [Helianthus annuus]